MNRRILLSVSLILLLFYLAACSAAPESSVDEPAAEAPVRETIVEGEVEIPAEESAAEAPAPLPSATQALQPTPAPTQPQLIPTALIEERLVEVEWPESLYLGDLDVVRMALIPAEEGYTLTTEFPDHTTTTQDVPIVRPEGYDLSAVGRLDGVGFKISPAKDQKSSLPIDQPVTWHWSLTAQQPGKQRLTVSLLLLWEPLPGTEGAAREAVAYSKGLEMQVKSFFGLSRAQTLNTALVGLALGGSVIFFAVVYSFPFKTRTIPRIGKPSQIREPNRAIEIERPAGLHLNPEEDALLRGLFQRYHRLIIQQEFLSGYSGARTFMLIPVRADGRSDAPTIAKLGRKTNIEQEYANYDAFVKRTLPPVTARIQAPPVMLKRGEKAALQYTFIGEPGTKPVSLRQTLLEDADPRLLTRLFETFGPNWWMQRTPWTFRLAQEYDRLLPPHWMLEPENGKGTPLDGGRPPTDTQLSIGKLVTLHNFSPTPSGINQDYLTLRGQSLPGQAALRLRWLDREFPHNRHRSGLTGRVTAARLDLLRSYATGFDLMGLPDPLAKLPTLLQEPINGTRSIIHGDLNLENVLIGPGGMIWLIDFATTREGHPLMDFAHLEAEIIAQVIAPQISDRNTFIALLGAQFATDKSKVKPHNSGRGEVLQALIESLHDMAYKCLANPSQPREYWLALYISCLGALKYRNLDAHQKYLLYLTAAYLGSLL